MSVIKNKRSLSELEFFHNAIKLRKEMTDLLLRDFGVKARKKDPQIFPKRYSMDKDDGEAFMKLCEKYKIVSIIETYPDWLSSISSGTNFCNVNNNGNANNNAAHNSNAVRPISCIRAKCRFNADTELQERGKYPSAR